MKKRNDGRALDELRAITIEKNVNIHAEGSAFIKVGNTHVLCVATVEEKVPPFLMKSGRGWVTAEYSMLPRSTTSRMRRERKGAGGRTMEIQRLIGRSLRSVVEMARLGERTVTIDCDVIQADGGTRTASITGAYIAMYDAMQKLVDDGVIASLPIKEEIAATSLGIFDGEIVLDLNYEEDSSADVDLNLVMTGSGLLVEIQGTAEENPFTREQLSGMLKVGEEGLREIFEIQRSLLANGK